MKHFIKAKDVPLTDAIRKTLDFLNQSQMSMYEKARHFSEKHYCHLTAEEMRKLFYRLNDYNKQKNTSTQDLESEKYAKQSLMTQNIGGETYKSFVEFVDAFINQSENLKNLPQQTKDTFRQILTIQVLFGEIDQLNERIALLEEYNLEWETKKEHARNEIAKIEKKYNKPEEKSTEQRKIQVEKYPKLKLEDLNLF